MRLSAVNKSVKKLSLCMSTAHSSRMHLMTDVTQFVKNLPSAVKTLPQVTDCQNDAPAKGVKLNVYASKMPIALT